MMMRDNKKKKNLKKEITEEEKVKNILKQEMESVINLKVPLVVEVSSGKTLYEAK